LQSTEIELLGLFSDDGKSSPPAGLKRNEVIKRKIHASDGSSKSRVKEPLGKQKGEGEGIREARHGQK